MLRMNTELFTMLAVIIFLSLFGALTGLNTPSRKKRISGFEFLVVSLVAWFPLIIVLVLDLLRLEGVVSHTSVDTNRLNLLLAIWFLLTSYPLFSRISWRLNDAGRGRFWGYMALLPYINIFVFLYLSVMPTKPDSPTQPQS